MQSQITKTLWLQKLERKKNVRESFRPNVFHLFVRTFWGIYNLLDKKKKKKKKKNG